jgi:hypothetical protein
VVTASKAVSVKDWKKRGPLPGGRKTAPVFPERVRRIVELRDVHGMTFDAISETLSTERAITKMGVCLAYNKWRSWVYAEGV